MVQNLYPTDAGTQKEPFRSLSGDACRREKENEQTWQRLGSWFRGSPRVDRDGSCATMEGRVEKIDLWQYQH
jgi:hypothetical protein